MVEQPPDQGTAAVDLQLTLRLGFQLADGRRKVTGEDGRVRPLRVGDRGSGQVLGRRVEQYAGRADTRPFDLAQLPEPVANPTDRDSGDWLDELRGGH